MTSTLVTGGNVQSAAQIDDIKTIGYHVITRNGARAKEFHRILKQAKQQGLTITRGTYKFSRWSEVAHALNIEFTGPRAVVSSFERYIDGGR